MATNRLVAIVLLGVLLQLSFFSQVALFHVSPDILPALVVSLGLRSASFAQLMLALGFRPTEAGVTDGLPRWIWRGAARPAPPPRAMRPQRENAFSVLAGIGRNG